MVVFCARVKRRGNRDGGLVDEAWERSRMAGSTGSCAGEKEPVGRQTQESNCPNGCQVLAADLIGKWKARVNIDQSSGRSAGFSKSASIDTNSCLLAHPEALDDSCRLSTVDGRAIFPNIWRVRESAQPTSSLWQLIVGMIRDGLPTAVFYGLLVTEKRSAEVESSQSHHHPLLWTRKKSNYA